LAEDDLRAQVKAIGETSFERVGQTLTLDAVALRGGGEGFSKAAQIAGDESPLPLILMNEDPSAMGEALTACGDKKPLIYAATPENVDAMAALAKEHGCPLAVRGADLSSLAETSEKAQAAGAADLILDSSASTVADELANQTAIRRSALRKRYRPFGFPTMTVTRAKDPMEEALEASAAIMKYTGIVVLSGMEPWGTLALVTVRQNIYTDPQKPIQIEEGLYEIGSPDASAPVMVTTNFSLTYFTVEGDVEASRVPAWVVVVDTEGTSVLTAWAAEKFTAEIIAEKVKAFDVASKVDHRKIILPGHVAVLSGKLEDELGEEWKVIVGPRESSGIPSFLRTSWSA
jgi:acetyl-CoA decarbonylase/synthase complex subunit gamma